VATELPADADTTAIHRADGLAFEKAPPIELN